MTGQALSLDVVSVKQELTVPAVTAIAEKRHDSEVEVLCDQYLTQWLDPENRASATNAVEEMGANIQQKAAERSKMLEQPIRDLAGRGEDGGPVATALVDLKNQVEGLDPGKFDFQAGWLSRTAGRLPFIGTPVKRYFTKFESAQTVIDAIDRSLVNGQDQLKRDNMILQDDQRRMRETADLLECQIEIGTLLDAKLERILSNTTNNKEQQFIETELLFPLRQRVTDIHQQLVVTQQGVIAIELIRRNNIELIRGVDRARQVTMSALSVAVTVALAVQNQKIVLDRITALNTTTSNIIADTAKAIRTQGAEIHRQASSSTLDLDSLRQAFQDIRGALDEISEYRRNALPQLKNTIDELADMSEVGRETLGNMDRARQSEGIATTV